MYFFPDAQGNFNAKVNDKVHVLMAMIATNISKVSRRWLKNDKFHSWYLMNCNPRTWHLHPLSWNWCISNKNYVGSTNLQVLHKSDKILQIRCWCSPYNYYLNWKQYISNCNIILLLECYDDMYYFKLIIIYQYFCINVLRYHLTTLWTWIVFTLLYP